MAQGDASHSEVKSICNGLECSPSQHDASGNYGGAPSLSPKNNDATSSKHKTKEFQMSDRGRALPNYKGQFARKAEQA